MRRPAVFAALSAAVFAVVAAAGCAANPQPTNTPPAASNAATPAEAGNCKYLPDGNPAKQVSPPSAQQPTSGTATVTLKLAGGEVTLELDQAKTPCTTGSFVHLAKSGYFDGTPCHRLTASASLQVLQCGDPSGTGGGGPGYRYADETSSDMVYPAGTVAMANAGPDTNGSQFFLVYADSMLPPNYTVFGSVTKGLDVLQGIAAKGTAGGGPDGAPATPVTIESAKVAA